MSKQCENFNGVLQGLNHAEKTKYLALARCKQWSCEYCSQKNKDKWRAKILDYINTHTELQWSWFTLTAHENTHKHKDITNSTYKNLTGGFSKVMKRMRRKFGNDIVYIRVFETHKSGALHIHCITSIHFDDIVTRNEGKKNEYKDSQWLRKNARECGLGYMTHADNVSVEQSFYAAGYVTKYMTKEHIGHDMFPTGARRIQSSRHIKITGDDSNSSIEWSLSNNYYERDFFLDSQTRIAVFSFITNRLITYDDFLDTNVLFELE